MESNKSEIIRSAKTREDNKSEISESRYSHLNRRQPDDIVSNSTNHTRTSMHQVNNKMNDIHGGSSLNPSSHNIACSESNHSDERSDDNNIQRDSYRAQPQDSYRAQLQPQDSYRAQLQPQDSYRAQLQPQDSYRAQAQPQDSYRAQPQPQDSYRAQAQDSYRAQPQDSYEQTNDGNYNMRERSRAEAYNDDFSREYEKKEDIKASMLDEIDFLMSCLGSEDVDISRIPVVSRSSSFEDVRETLSSLRYKQDRIRYCSFAEEFILFGAYGLEELFNGERSWLGRQPDLTGWHNQVTVKLRRMRHDTSTVVSAVMEDYNIGPGARILLELIPNMFLHSRRKNANKQTTAGYTAQISESMTKIRDA
jgi:hypothetical protein